MVDGYEEKPLALKAGSRTLALPVTSPLGEGWLLEWPDEATRCEVSHVREARDDIYATVQWQAESLSGWYDLTGAKKLNLTGMTTTAAHAKDMGAYNRGDGFDWRVATEQMAMFVTKVFREGAPVIRFGDMPHERRQVDFLIDGLLPRHMTSVLHADMSQGKSMFANAMALAVATKQERFAGRFLVRAHGPVLYLDWETEPEIFDRRTAALLEGLGIPRDQWGILPIHYRHMTGGLGEHLAYIRKIVDKEHILLVIIDSLAWATADDPSAAAAAIKVMDSTRMLGTTNLVLAHQTKEDKGKGQEATTFGSVFYENAARNVWAMRSAPDGENGAKSMMLFHKKSNETALLLQPIGFRMTFEDEAIQLNWAPRDGQTKEGLNARILRDVGDNGWSTPEEIATRLRSKDASVKSCCTRLVTSGNLMKQGNKYKLPDAGFAAPAGEEGDGTDGPAIDESAGGTAVATAPAPAAVEELAPEGEGCEQDVEGGKCRKLNDLRVTPKGVFLCGGHATEYELKHPEEYA